MVESDGADAMTANLVGSSSDKQALVAAPRWPLAYVALCLANMAEAVEVLTAGYILERATDDEFVQTSIAAAVFIGMMFGGLFSGPAADAYGRAALLKWALALSTVASFAAAASPEAVVLVLCRFVAGAGVGAATPPLFALAVALRIHAFSSAQFFVAFREGTFPCSRPPAVSMQSRARAAFGDGQVCDCAET